MKSVIRPADQADAEAISAVIVSALRETNANDYSREVIARVEKSFGPAAVRKLIENRTVFVATRNGEIVGTASLDGKVVRTVFVSPALHGRGIGTQLMNQVEQIARTQSIATLTVPSSVTAESFYAKLGFVAVRDSYHGEERTIIMERDLELSRKS